MTVEAFLDALGAYLRGGGLPVMGTLALATLLLWYVIGYRALTLRRGTIRNLPRLIEDELAGRAPEPRGLIDRAAFIGVRLARTRHPNLRDVLDDGLAEIEYEMAQGKILIGAVVSVAPLLGLLGTVTGMIETFDSLGDNALYSQSGGIAGGISQALFTTQMGLSVAVPGVILAMLLNRRERALSDELEAMKDMLCHRFTPIPLQ